MNFIDKPQGSVAIIPKNNSVFAVRAFATESGSLISINCHTNKGALWAHLYFGKFYLKLVPKKRSPFLDFF